MDLLDSNKSGHTSEKKSNTASKRRWTEVMSAFSPQIISRKAEIPAKQKFTRRRLNSCSHVNKNEVSTKRQIFEDYNLENVEAFEFEGGVNIQTENSKRKTPKFCIDAVYSLLFGDHVDPTTADDDVTVAKKCDEKTDAGPTKDDVMHAKEISVTAFKSSVKPSDQHPSCITKDPIALVKVSEISSSDMSLKTNANTSINSDCFSKFMKCQEIDMCSQVDSNLPLSMHIETSSQSSNENCAEIVSTSSLSYSSQSSNISNSSRTNFSQPEPVQQMKGKFDKGGLAEKARQRVLKALSEEKVFKHMKCHEKHAACVSKSGRQYHPTKFSTSGPTVVFEVSEDSKLLMFRRNVFPAVDLSKVETLTVFDVYRTVYLIDRTVVFPSLFEFTLGSTDLLPELSFE